MTVLPNYFFEGEKGFLAYPFLYLRWFIFDLFNIFLFQILKNRYTGDLGIMPLNFNKSTLSFSGKQTKDTAVSIREIDIEEQDTELSPPKVEKESSGEVFLPYGFKKKQHNELQ